MEKKGRDRRDEGERSLPGDQAGGFMSQCLLSRQLVNPLGFLSVLRLA